MLSPLTLQQVAVTQWLSQEQVKRVALGVQKAAGWMLTRINV